MDLQSPLLDEVRLIIRKARTQLWRQTNTLLLSMYWDIGRLIVEDEQQGRPRAAYGRSVLEHLARQLTFEFGKGFDQSNLRNMRQFYLAFPKYDALRHELSWTHYRILSRIEDTELRHAYLLECIRCGWNTRTLQRSPCLRLTLRIQAPGR